MSSTITLYTRNILESGTVDVTGAPDTGYPESRLYDRHISLFWKDTVTEAKNFTVDQGATGNLAVDFLAIESHNFDNKTMQWQWSTDNFSGDVNDAVTDWSQSGNGQIIKTLDPAFTKRYWRVSVSSIANPQCSEIFMSYGHSFTILANPYPRAKKQANVSWRRTVGGSERSTKFGDARKVRTYAMKLDSSALADFQNAMDDLDEYSKPFYICDHDGNYWMCRLLDEPEEHYSNKAYTTISISVIEML